MWVWEGQGADQTPVEYRVGQWLVNAIEKNRAGKKTGAGGWKQPRVAVLRMFGGKVTRVEACKR